MTENERFPSARNIKIEKIEDFMNKKVRILGSYIPSDSSVDGIIEGIIDDGTSSIKFVINGDTNKKLFTSLKKSKNKTIRIVGRVVMDKNQILSIKTDYVQDMRKLNKELYLKVEKLKIKMSEK
jgi:hypothetical protein